MPDPTPPSFPGGQSVQVDTGFTTVADLPAPPDSPNLNMAGGSYLGWGQLAAVDEDMGYGQLPVCGPGGTASRFVRSNGGKAKMLVTGVAIRVGDHPQLPPSAPQWAGQVLMFRRRVPFTPQQQPAGGRVFGVAWLYIYGLEFAPSEYDLFYYGQSPYDVGGADALNPSDYLSYLNAPRVSPSGVFQTVNF